MSVDKYGVDQDPACYPGTGVLINLLNLQDADDLAEAERYLTQTAAAQLEFIQPPYDVGTLKQIHRHLFCQLESSAGNIRTVKISKGESIDYSVAFCAAWGPNDRKAVPLLGGRSR